MKRYDSYKDSGVEWIGEIPGHWIKKKLGYSIDTIVPMRDKPTSLKGEIPWIRIEDYDGKYIYGSKSNQGVTQGLIDEMNLKVYPINTVLTTCSCSFGTSMIVKEPMTSNQTFIGLFPNKNDLNEEYLYYQLHIWEVELDKMSSGSIQKYLSRDNFKSLRFLFPPINEQQQIVSFLDSKTCQIDELIQKKERKIELLKEYRTSLINQVVTKGLNPNVEMKDSGVEWIGEIPSDWGMVKLKQLFNINKRISGELGFDVLSVTQRGLRVKDLENNEGQHSMDYSKYQLVFEGDFVMNHMDLLTGYVDVSKGTGVTSPDYRVFTQSVPYLNQHYYLNLFQLCYKRRIFYGLGRGVSNLGRWRLPSSEFLNMYIPFPSENEQNQIVSFLEDQTSKIDSFIQTEERKIELLKEYRQSLISSVVTGKIDVRTN